MRTTHYVLRPLYTLVMCGTNRTTYSTIACENVLLAIYVLGTVIIHKSIIEQGDDKYEIYSP